MKWSIHKLSRAAGVTSRALRHYDAIGLLIPSRVAINGYRFYDDASQGEELMANEVFDGFRPHGPSRRGHRALGRGRLPAR